MGIPRHFEKHKQLALSSIVNCATARGKQHLHPMDAISLKVGFLLSMFCFRNMQTCRQRNMPARGLQKASLDNKLLGENDCNYCTSPITLYAVSYSWCRHFLGADGTFLLDTLKEAAAKV
jgi:hypothetical protein